MGILDAVLGGLKEQLGDKGGSNNSLIDGIVDLISKQGGLGNLGKTLSASGLGPKVDSWIGKGTNEGVTGTELKDALGTDYMKDIGDAIGANPDDASDQVADLLPQVFDKLTPDGYIDESEERWINQEEPQ